MPLDIISVISQLPRFHQITSLGLNIDYAFTSLEERVNPECRS